MYKVLFRLDSGGQFGLGHFMRCKALADALHEEGLICVFAVQQLHSEDAVKPHELIFIDDEQDFLAQVEAYDVLIIDHYNYEAAMFYALSQLSAQLIVLDDECNRGFLYADIIINPLNHAKYFNYKQLAPKANCLLGMKYTLLREEFLACQPIEYSNRETIVITFGGSDVTHLSLPVAKLMQAKMIQHDYLRHLKLLLISGAGCQNSEAIKNYCLQNNIDYQHDVKNMAEIFSRAKFAISAAGSTAYELAFCGVPAILAVVADNQLFSAKEQSKLAWCEMIDCRNQNNAQLIVQRTMNMLMSEKLSFMSNKARTLVDGNGASRIVKQIKKALY